MPLPPTSTVFQARLGSLPSAPLREVIQQELEDISKDIDMNTPPPSSSDSVDMINELGEYFTRTANIWARLTEQLVKGPHIAAASARAHERSQIHTGMSDLGELAKIDVGIGRLRLIRDLSAKFCTDVQDAWQLQNTELDGEPSDFQTSVSPFCDSKLPSFSNTVSLSGDSESLHFPLSRKVMSDGGQYNHMSQGDASASDDSSDDEEQFQSIDMDALRQRGKGSYYCPKGKKCDKGGVDKDGNLVVFDRNSSFAQHCNKHRKPWRCDLAGCPNPPKKRRFARRDGLERHKATVKHFALA